MTDRTAPTILFIHGFPLDGSIWDAQVNAFRASARVLAPDLRGFGTDQRSSPKVMTMDAYASDLRALLDAEGIDRVVLCGLSMGGYIALAFVAAWPERVQALVLCNTRATADTPEGREAREATAQDAISKGMPVIARAMVPKVLSETTRRSLPDVAGRVERIMSRQRPEAVAAASRGMALRADRMVMLSGISAPTLIVTGAEDQLMPLPTSEAMAAAIPGSRLVVIPDVAHLSNVEAPAVFNAHLDHFLTGLTPGNGVR